VQLEIDNVKEPPREHPPANGIREPRSPDPDAPSSAEVVNTNIGEAEAP
jgi:hypothetical protein